VGWSNLPIFGFYPAKEVKVSKFQIGFGVAVLFALAGCAATGGVDPKANIAPDKVVYHVNDAGAQAAGALRNIGNHLEVNPKARIVVVTHAQGVDFLMDGAKDRNGNPYNILVEEMKGRGVKFDVCEITLRNRNMTKGQFIPEATFVPSGVAEITRLQQREGYAYLRP
jgi:intracellular sulfur oxidation DsrE/DsrF family protein